MVDTRPSFGLTRVTPNQFKKQIHYLLEQGYTFVSILDYLKGANKKNLVALTFDDAYESVYKYAFPLMLELDLPASVFVITNYVGQYNTWDVHLGRRFRHMDWAQLKELAQAGWEIGSHGLDHSDFTRLSQAKLVRQMFLSCKLIQDHLGTCSKVISFPFGNVSQNVSTQLQRFNFSTGLVMGTSAADIPSQYSIQRLGIYLTDILPIYKLKLGKYYPVFKSLQRLMDKCSNLTVRIKQ